MLNANEARNAIFYFYKDQTGLQVGNPQPFVRSYDNSDAGAGSITNFNELMIDSVTGKVKNIFYGYITISYYKGDGALTTEIIGNVYLDLNGDTDVSNLHILKEDLLAPDYALLTTQAILMQQLILTGNISVSLDGYIFGIQQQTT